MLTISHLAHFYLFKNGGNISFSARGLHVAAVKFAADWLLLLVFNILYSFNFSCFRVNSVFLWSKAAEMYLRSIGESYRPEMTSQCAASLLITTLQSTVAY